MEKKSRVSGNKIIFIAIWLIALIAFVAPVGSAQGIQEPNAAGSFYPDGPKHLAQMIDDFLENADPENPPGPVFALISPHAGYGYSGQVAGFGYKLIKNKPYKTVIILGASHRYPFGGASVYPGGEFRTPLGLIQVDSDFSKKLLNKDPEINFIPEAFKEEHSVEVQLPFLQKALKNFKIVPIVLGDCPLSTCQKLASLLKEAIGARKDVLVVVSTDAYHGYDYEEADKVDGLTLSAIKNMDSQALYYGLRDEKMQLCGGFAAVTALTLAKSLGHDKVIVLKHTNSCAVTGNMRKGIWTVGYASCVIDQPAEEATMLNKSQRKRLLEIARATIETYLKSGKKPPVKESDPALLKDMGAFVTLNQNGQLRGCIGNLVGTQALSLTISDMAVEAATGDPRFNPVELAELQGIEIEISVLSPLEKIADPDDIKLGVHGVLLRNGYRSGVFLPQVATETGWSKEEFMSNLCSHKAGLSADAWKDKSTDIYIFTAEVFSEKNY